MKKKYQPTFVIVRGKQVQLFKYQEECAQRIADSIMHYRPITIRFVVGVGKGYIMQRVADIINNRP